MERGLFNITSATTTTLRTVLENAGNIRSVSLANTHSSTAVNVQLFLEDEANNKSYIVSTDIPGSAALFIDQGLSYNGDRLSLKITTTAGGLSTSTPLSVIIK
jgi:hypothetical protein|tara:strand:- start:427 stop:735 length:309 start_codon:yes stop_codon:yes gene_type:complete